MAKPELEGCGAQPTGLLFAVECVALAPFIAIGVVARAVYDRI